MTARPTALLLVPLLVAPGLWGGLQLYRALWYLMAGSSPFDQVQPVFLAGLIVLGVVIGWAVLLTDPPRSLGRDTARAAALGISTVLLPACQLALVLPVFGHSFAA
ncbi:hypothetical protein [Cryptosporangium aurantiacum]|uniref:Uncharacterized protein n=1 Tax=Cryptosporangium aurantiacum TaxID=134849 RepID=A0A1M7RDS7_9ACTN|nr:hypothetical protein [Cryptosporangium aurantiacum]SHN44299.1 hypothetical protein SAMN05443668_110154 [Cryptosporangium aurantiacum]